MGSSPSRLPLPASDLDISPSAAPPSPSPSASPRSAHFLTFNEALPLITRLDPAGLKFAVWESQLKLMIRQVTGLSCDYLDDPASTAADKRADHLILCMIIWSIDEQLQIDIGASGTAREAFQKLKKNVDPASLNLIVKSLASSHRYDPPTLSSLPLEILDRIIHHVRQLARLEGHRICEAKKLEQTEGRRPRYPLPCYIYEAKGIPKLNSLQSLASVNKGFNQLCRGLLWTHVQFPGSTPGHVSRWTQQLLFKYGDLVRFVSIDPVFDWCKPDPDENMECDGLSIPNRVREPSLWYLRGLSYENTVKILAMCPNVHSLEFNLPVDFSGQLGEGNGGDAISSEDLQFIYTRLEFVISQFPALRHLQMVAGRERASDNWVTSIIKHLPLLESLHVTCLDQSPPDEPNNTFVWHLTQLKHLSKLKLRDCDAVDESWSLESWPQIITELQLESCHNLSLLSAQQLIPAMAPNLIDLTLKLSDQDDAVDCPLADRHQFNLPALRTLDIGDMSNSVYAFNFENCKNLQHLICSDMRKEYWTLTQHLICESTWPQLYHVNVRWVDTIHDSADWNINVEWFKLRKYCDTAGIELRYPVKR